MGEVCSICDDNPRTHEVEVAQEELVQLAGRWVSGRGNIHFIGLEEIKWSSGDSTKWFRRKSPYDGQIDYCTEVNGALFVARLDEDGRLQWSDGDGWTRDEIGPTTGTYDTITGVLKKARGSLQEVSESTMSMAAPMATAVGTSLPTMTSWASPAKPAQPDEQGGSTRASSPSAASPPAWEPWDDTPPSRETASAREGAAGGVAPRPKRKAAPSPGSNTEA
mmetsp:Transcript_126804/g.355100  ORF Transcript_126804/g.355100 Transcript_126804/m.355100 type:complete len:221 (+) Transcript_126804:72-734(+)